MDGFGEERVAGEIRELEAEVARLETAVKDQEKQNMLLKAWLEEQGNSPSDEEEEIGRAKLESLRNEVDLLRKVTDVAITDVTTCIISQERLKVKKKKQVNGYCGKVEFQLNMDVEEYMDEGKTVHSRVTHLSISASESVYRDLREVVEGLAEAGDVQGFLTLLRPYSIWQVAREKVCEHFVAAFPNIVKRKNVQTLLLSHPIKKCCFEIVWHFKIRDLFTVLPDLQVMVHVPKKVESSSQDFLAAVPEKFQLMLNQLGVEKTLNCLVALLAK